MTGIVIAQPAPVGDPGQHALHADLGAVSAAARAEAERERARRMAPFDLWWAVR